jgi:hypothetical protein
MFCMGAGLDQNRVVSGLARVHKHQYRVVSGHRLDKGSAVGWNSWAFAFGVEIAETAVVKLAVPQRHHATSHQVDQWAALADVPLSCSGDGTL